MSSSSIALEFVELAHSLVKSQAGLEDKTIGEILIEIAEKAAQTYYDHMGEPLDTHLNTALDSIQRCASPGFTYTWGRFGLTSSLICFYFPRLV